MMIQIATPDHPDYKNVSAFARQQYGMRLHAGICADADAFAYALERDRVIGCFGIYRAHAARRLLIEKYIPDAFARISGTCCVNRRHCAEIGTRAVEKTPGSSAFEVTLALSASLIIHAHRAGVSLIAFTANRTVNAIAEALNIQLIALGPPDVSRMPAEFLCNWKDFFRVRQYCFGFRIGSLEGCAAILRKLEAYGIRSDAGA